MDISNYTRRNYTICAMAALNKAISEGRFKQVRCFINLGINVNSKCKNGNTALIQLCSVEKHSLAISMATCLLKRGAKIDATDSNGLSALSTAVLRQNENLVSLFLEEAGNFDLNSKDKRGNTALFYAADTGNFNILNALVTALNKYQLSVDIANHNGFTPLIQACVKGNVDCANYLINEGKASLNIRDNKYRKTAVEWAKIKGIPVRVLLSKSDSSGNGFTGDNKNARFGKNRMEGGQKEDKKCGSKDAANIQRIGSYKDQFTQLYKVYECQLTASFKPVKKPKTKLLPPIEQESSSARSSPRVSRYLSRSKSTHRFLKRASLEKSISRKSPQQKFQRSQSVTDLTIRLDLKNSESLVSPPTMHRSCSARSGGARQELEKLQTDSRAPSASSMPTVETVFE